MMLFQVTYTMLPGQRDAFLQMMRESGILDQIRREEGCLDYLSLIHILWISWEQAEEKSEVCSRTSAASHRASATMALRVTLASAMESEDVYKRQADPGLSGGGADQSGGLRSGGGADGAGGLFAPAVRGGRGRQFGHCRPGGHAPGGPCADGGGEVGPAAGSGPGLLLAVSAQLDPHYHPLHLSLIHISTASPSTSTR